MSAKAQVDDDSTEPEYTDAEVREAAQQLHEFIKDDWKLDLVCGGTHAQQIDNPRTDDCDAITLYMDGDVGSGATKATIIQKVLDSDLPLALRNTCEGHGMVEFAITA